MYGNYPDLSDVKKILVVKLRHLGDVLLTSGLLTYLKTRLPQAIIDVYLYRESKPILEDHPAVSQFFLCDRKKRSFLCRLKGEVALLWRLRREKYDLVINLTEGDRGALAAYLSGARYRLGPEELNRGFLFKNKLYTHRVKKPALERHTVEKHFDYARCLGLFPSPQERALSFFIPQEVREKVAHLTKDWSPYCLIHPTSRWLFKAPPASFMAQLIQELHRQGCSLVLSSGPQAEELSFIQNILTHCREVPLLNLSGILSLKELGAVIERAESLICVDSLPLHFASALKTPVVALFGPTSEKNWGPWQHPRSRVLTSRASCRPCFLDGCGGSKMSDCLSHISIDQVLAAKASL